jgi:flagellar biosynthetic protein FlhB
MAGERTEQATPKKLKTLRDQGQVAHSNDLTTALTLLGALYGLKAFGGEAVAQLERFMRRQLGTLPRTDFGADNLGPLAGASLEVFLAVMVPLLAVVMVLGVLANIGQVGFVLSGQGASPQLQRINPLSALQRYFSARTLVELIKTLAKVGIVGWIIYRAYVESLPSLTTLVTLDLQASLPRLGDMLLGLGLTAALVLLALSAIDYGYQRWQFQRDARMSFQELKEERKETEGSPEIRGRIRQMQRKLARGG